MTLIHYKNQKNVVNLEILETDLINFSVLHSILQNTCTDIFTDHQNVIICYSYPPYPIWVWIKNINIQKNIQEIAICLKKHFKENKFILTKDLYKKLQNIDDYFNNFVTETTLISYKLDKINIIDKKCEGKARLAQINDLDYLTILYHDMQFETLGFNLSLDICKQKVESLINQKSLYIWVNDNMEIVSLTSKNNFNIYSKISSVYTLPKYRRQGYAINLVYYVCKNIIKDGLTPILYTDADYEASNICYQKIGFKKIDMLLTLKKNNFL